MKENILPRRIIDLINLIPIEDIINKITALNKNRKKILEFKKNIEEFLKEEYDWDEILLSLKNKYIEVIQNSKKL